MHARVYCFKEISFAFFFRSKLLFSILIVFIVNIITVDHSFMISHRFAL